MNDQEHCIHSKHRGIAGLGVISFALALIFVFIVLVLPPLLIIGAVMLIILWIWNNKARKRRIMAEKLSGQAAIRRCNGLELDNKDGVVYP